jgi:hypothetical protein
MSPKISISLELGQVRAMVMVLLIPPACSVLQRL